MSADEKVKFDFDVKDTKSTVRGSLDDGFSAHKFCGRPIIPDVTEDDLLRSLIMLAGKITQQSTYTRL